jgi:hypothetical protein
MKQMFVIKDIQIHSYTTDFTLSTDGESDAFSPEVLLHKIAKMAGKNVSRCAGLKFEIIVENKVPMADRPNKQMVEEGLAERLSEALLDKFRKLFGDEVEQHCEFLKGELVDMVSESRKNMFTDDDLFLAYMRRLPGQYIAEGLVETFENQKHFQEWKVQLIDIQERKGK